MLQIKKEKWPRTSQHHWLSLYKISQSTLESLNHPILKVSVVKAHSIPERGKRGERGRGRRRRDEGGREGVEEGREGEGEEKRKM